MTLRVRKTMLDPLAHHVGHEWMQPERSRDKIANPGMLARGCRGEMRNIFAPMASRKQKIRENDDRLSTAGHAPRKGGVDRRLGQLHVRRLDDRKAGGRCELSDYIQQQLVAFAPTRPMIDNYHADSLFIVVQKRIRVIHR